MARASARHEDSRLLQLLDSDLTTPVNNGTSDVPSVPCRAATTM